MVGVLLMFRSDKLSLATIVTFNCGSSINVGWDVQPSIKAVKENL